MRLINSSGRNNSSLSRSLLYHRSKEYFYYMSVYGNLRKDSCLRSHLCHLISVIVHFSVIVPSYVCLLFCSYLFSVIFLLYHCPLSLIERIVLGFVWSMASEGKILASIRFFVIDRTEHFKIRSVSDIKRYDSSLRLLLCYCISVIVPFFLLRPSPLPLFSSLLFSVIVPIPFRFVL